MKSSLLIAVVVLLFFSAVNGQGNGAVRLNMNGDSQPTHTQGVAEVYYSNRWGPICDRYAYGSYGNIPSVVCHQLGYTGGSSGSSSKSLSTPPVIYNVSCSINNLVILQCTYSTYPAGCSSSDNLEVTCYSTRIWNSPYNGMIRLQDGYYSGQGTVQVYCNNDWGVVCNSGSFDSYAATTVCTQLGYNDYVTYSSTSYTGKAWLNDVNCLYQSCLSECSGGNCPSSSVSCSSAANVTCTYTESSYSSGSTRYTCDGVDDISGLTAGAIAAIIIASLILFFVCVALIIAIPICICCCLGIGIGAAAGSTTAATYANL